MSTFKVSRQTYSIDSLIEKAFSDGYEYAQREYSLWGKLANVFTKKARNAEAKTLKNLRRKKQNIENEISQHTGAGGSTTKAAKNTKKDVTTAAETGTSAAETEEKKSGWGKKALIGGGIAAGGGGLYLANKKNK